MNRRQALRPCERMSIAPRIESAISSAIVHQTPISSPIWMITNSSTIGTTTKRTTRNGSTLLRRVRGAGCASRRSGRGRRDEHAGQAVEADELDQPLDLRPRAVDAHALVRAAQPAGEHREVEHERRVGELQLGEVDREVLRASASARDRGRRRRLCVARSSSPQTRSTKACSSSETMAGTYPNPSQRRVLDRG